MFHAKLQHQVQMMKLLIERGAEVNTTYPRVC